MIYNDYISASNVTLKTYLSPLESLFWNDFMGHIRELGAIGPAKPLRNTGYFFLIFSRDQESSSFPAQAFGYEIAENCIFKASA